MSRCFPFPPPGYEKARRDDVDLLKKGRDREKKLKKEKKKEGKDKEKKEKDRSDGKHRDKKEKKEKHRDKKEKDRDKDKDKISVSDEKRLLGKSEHNNEEKTPDEKKPPGKSEVNSGEIFIQKGKERGVGRKSLSGEKKFSGEFSGYSERVSQNSYLIEQPSSFVQEVDRRTPDEARGSRKQLIDKFISVNSRNDEGMVGLVAKATGTLADSKAKNKKGDDRKFDGQGIRDESRFSGKTIAQSFPGTVQTRIDKTPTRPPEKDIEKRIDGKDKSKQKEGDDIRGDKQKDKVKGIESQGKDKEKKKEEKVREKSEHNVKAPDKSKANNKVDLIGIHNAKASHLPKEITVSGLNGGNPRKRKELDTNGFFNANGIKPSKMPRPDSSHPFIQNGKMLETAGTSIASVSDRQGAVNNIKVDAKERKINGVIETQALSISSTAQRPSIPTSAHADQIAKVSRKPHPDSKYLSEVLTVPRMEEWCDFDEQEWLFQGRDSQSKRLRIGSLVVDETPQVWSEALQIESADVCALPYVIPY